jgi:hypothetical protein
MTEADLATSVSPENFVNIRTIYGGVAPSETNRAVKVERERELEDDSWYTESTDHLKRSRENLDRIVQKKVAKA